jgi:hypothetical protein
VHAYPRGNDPTAHETCALNVGIVFLQGVIWEYKPARMGETSQRCVIRDRDTGAISDCSKVTGARPTTAATQRNMWRQGRSTLCSLTYLQCCTKSAFHYVNHFHCIYSMSWCDMSNEPGLKPALAALDPNFLGENSTRTASRASSDSVTFETNPSVST